MINLKTSPSNFPMDKLQNLPNSRGVTCTSKVILEKFIMTALNHALGCEEYSGKIGLKRPIKIEISSVLFCFFSYRAGQHVRGKECPVIKHKF